ncbi:biogenesis of lysosome-related organelles complex 1 subunit 5-like [Hydractinia symbiolongicarpus]|uniref:biogenesis of lysosome-related organelles complex 1 subunit 5-like n=1 Tax=Hydractinia symbiolongicarpus TaxID=13093 RepID=UPI00254A4428|nr:biogenesis of lysosome-related organelles complex 1 subunit 5-like [Hydractinia symbiolongicarpus]XP_057299044.1 biogenesis of lysosome-related organelles complex 1 subunit 5-like [Hydractinia symbiolongicarpus]
MAEEVEMLCKDVFAITSRLFDHKAVTRAESKYLVRELELKKSKDSLKIFQDVVHQSEKTKSRIPECIDLINERVEKVHTLVVSAASNALDVLSSGGNNDDETREDLKKKREKEWEEFMKEMNQAQANVLEKHRERMAELDTKEDKEI